MLEQVEASLDLMITLKDALQCYREFLQECLQKGKEASIKMTALISQIEKLVGEQAALMQEIGNLGKRLEDVNQRHSGFQETLQTVNTLETLEEQIREREQSKSSMLQRLNITLRDESVKLLDLDIQAMAARRNQCLEALKEQGVSREKVRSVIPSLESQMKQLSDERAQKEAELLQQRELRKQYEVQFEKLKSLEQNKRKYEISSGYLEELAQIVNAVRVDTSTVPIESEASITEGGVQC